MKISTKILAAYKTSKYGSKIANCADSYAISPNGLKLAVADGVSKSYMPKYVADALTAIYVSDECKGGEIFNDENATPLLSKVINYWDEKSKELEASVDEDTRFDLEDQRELYGMGASTFAGVTLGENAFTFDVLGDSCIFLFPYDADLQPMILTSMPAEVDTTLDHPFICDFGVHPHFLDTKGRIVGEPLEKSVPPFSGIIVLATDAMSDWICRHYVNGQLGQLLQNFTNLNSPEEFDDYINVLRDQDLKNDDVAIVVAEVNIDADDDSLKIYDESLCIDIAADDNTSVEPQEKENTDTEMPQTEDAGTEEPLERVIEESADADIESVDIESVDIESVDIESVDNVQQAVEANQEYITDNPECIDSGEEYTDENQQNDDEARAESKLKNI